MSRLLATLLLALAAPAAAWGHGVFGTPAGYVATVSTLEPNVLGLQATVLRGDVLQVRNWSGKRVVIFGYDGEPFLRFGRDGVFRNARSPTTYLNRNIVTLRPGVSADAPPRWERISRRTSYGWHDHRVLWIQEEPPAAVRREPDKPHYVLDWNIPGTADGERFVIRGFLGYSPPPGSGSGVWLWVLRGAALGVGVVVLAGVVAVGIRRSRAPVSP